MRKQPNEEEPEGFESCEAELVRTGTPGFLTVMQGVVALKAPLIP